MFVRNQNDFRNALVSLRANDDDEALKKMDLLYKLESQEFLDLIDALVNNTVLQELGFATNDIDDARAEILATLLAKNPRLIVLQLFFQPDLGNRGAKALALALGTNTCLQALTLSSSSIGEEGVKDLANALMANNSLQHLDLSGNPIGDNGVKILAKAMMINQSLHLRLINIVASAESWKYLLILQRLHDPKRFEFSTAFYTDPNNIPYVDGLRLVDDTVRNFRKMTFGRVMLPMFRLLEAKKKQEGKEGLKNTWNLSKPGIASDIFSNELTRELYKMLGAVETAQQQRVIHILKELHEVPASPARNAPN